MFCCKEAARLISESLDHRLTFWQRAGLQFHLLICRFCRHFNHDLHLFDTVLRTYSRQIDANEELLQAALRPEARQRILQAIEQERL